MDAVAGRATGGDDDARPTLPDVRPDLVALEGYHSAQVDVDVRLNTNESPLPPPVGWQEALADAVAGIAFNRYPDREATELKRALATSHGVGADEVFCANGSCSNRRTPSTARSPGSPAPRWPPGPDVRTSRSTWTPSPGWWTGPGRC